MKKYFIITICLFFTILPSALAKPIDDECLDNETCIVLCNYVTSITASGSYSSGYQPRYWNRNLTIYYNFDTQDITIKWQATNKDARVSTKGPDSFNRIFSNSGTNIYWGIDEEPNIENFVCPENGYLDTSDLNSGNELCFDNDGTTCKEDYSNLGTAFAHHGGFTSQEKDYDFEDDIANYQNWIFGDIKEEISNGTFDVEQDLKDKILKDFRTNYLHDNEAPAFMVNSPAYIELMNNIDTAYNEAKKEELEKAEEELEEGNITDEEYNEIVNNWDNDVEQVVNQATTAFENIKLNSFIDIDFDVSNGCKSYLGDPSDSGSPAYYLQFSFNIMKYAAIIMLFVFTFIDFTKAVASSKDDAIKKATQNAIKRVIIAIIIFFLPILIEFLLSLFGIYSNCGIS